MVFTLDKSCRDKVQLKDGFYECTFFCMMFQKHLKPALIGTLIFFGCKGKKLEILPLSPYEQTVKYVQWDTTKEYFYAVKQFSPSDQNIKILDSFVLANLPRDLLKGNYGINFCFYKYEAGKIDEHFIHKEEPKQQNLFMEAGAKMLIKYSWLNGKFLYVQMFDKNGDAHFEKRNW